MTIQSSASFLLTLFLAALIPCASSAETSNAEPSGGQESGVLLQGETVPPQPPPDRKESLAEESFKKYQDETTENLRKIDAVIPLINAQHLGSSLTSWEPVARLTQKMCKASKADPRVRELACLLYAKAERHRGRMAKSEQVIRSQGVITEFMVAGPFDNEGKAGCTSTLPPESELDLDAVMQGKKHAVRWRTLPEGFPPLGAVEFSKIFTPASDAVGFAYTILEAEKDIDAVLSLGTRGAVQVFFDGTRILNDESYHDIGSEQNRLALKIPKGRHKLLLKVCGNSDAPNFRIRILDKKGRVPAGLTAVLPSSSSEPDNSDVRKKIEFSRLKTLADEFKSRAAAAPNDWKAQWKYAFIADFFGYGDKSERIAIEASAKAAELSKGDPEALWLAAELTDKWSEEIGYLTAILAADPGHPKAAKRKSRMDAINGQPNRGLEILQKALEVHPEDPELILAKATYASQNFGLIGERENAVKKLLERWPDLGSVLQAAAQQEEARNRYKRAVELRRTALSLDYYDLSTRRDLAESLLKLGDFDGAIEEYKRITEISPWGTSDWLKLARVLGNNGRREEAQEALRRAREIDPDNPSLHESAGHILSSMGLSDEALTEFRRSLELKPQNAPLREILKSITQEKSGFGEDMAVPVRDLAAAHPARQGEDAVVLQQLMAIQVYPSGLASRYSRLAARAQTPRGVEMLRRQWATQNSRQGMELVTAKIHKPDGSVVESYRKSFRNLSDPATSLYYDVRANLIEFPDLAPGDIIEIAWRIEDSVSENILSDYFGDLRIVRGEIIKERFDYALKMPPGRDLNVSFPEGLGIQSSRDNQEDGSTVYRFSAQNVPKFIPEPDMPGAEELLGLIHVSTFEKWEDVGKYYAGLIRDQLTVTDGIRNTLKEILKTVPKKNDRLAIVKAVYEFVISRTRYVGLEFGIHSFKPYPAHKVLSRRFGDCKDKASLMHVLLKEAGIDSALVLLRMKRHGSISSSPASLSVFDHAILYVPEFDLFLDGTAEFHGPEEIPYQDAGAQVLIVFSDGSSRFTRIPDFPPERNVNSLALNIAVSAEGSAAVRGTLTVSGQVSPSLRHNFQAEGTRVKNFEMLMSKTFPGVSVKSLDVGAISDIFSPVRLSFEFQAANFAAAAAGGSLRFLPFGRRSGKVQRLAKLSTRQTPLNISLPGIQEKDIKIELPEGYTAGELPKPVSLNTQNLSFTLSFSAEDGGRSIRARSKFFLKIREVKPENYPAFRDELRRVDEAMDMTVQALPVPAAQ